MAITEYLENKLLDHACGRTSFTMPTVYIALFKTAPNDAGGGTECAYTSYARVALDTGSDSLFAAASGGASSNAEDIEFPEKTGGSDETVQWWATFDASSNGNMLEYGTFDSAKTVSNGDAPVIRSGQLTRTAD